MQDEILYVVDANVIVSAALLPGSVPRRAFDKASEQGKLLLSEAVVHELDETLRYPRLDRYVSEQDRIHFLVALVHEAVIINVSESITDCRDPDDNKYLELAVAGTARCIITGDADLLVLHPFRGIPILAPRQFLDAE